MRLRHSYQNKQAMKRERAHLLGATHHTTLVHIATHHASRLAPPSHRLGSPDLEWDGGNQADHSMIPGGTGQIPQGSRT